MGRSGIARHARGFGRHDHLCWAYDDTAEFQTRVREFAADGLAAGQRVCYAGAARVSCLVTHLNVVAEHDHARRRGELRVVPLDELCPAGAPAEPEARPRACARATEAALAGGYTGFRVAAEITGCPTSPTRLNALVRFEHLVDTSLAVQPVSALCGFDRRARRGCCASLGGELDLASAELFPRALRPADPRPVRGRPVLDATTLDFIDHRNLFTLAEHARRHAAGVVLRAPRAGAATVVDLLNLDNVQVEVAR